MTKKKIGKKKSGSALLSPDKHKTVPKGRRFLPSFWKWLMTPRGALELDKKKSGSALTRGDRHKTSRREG
ncbi:hypothetical protein [Neobacillus massiliamazoniensis]|uniref:hypothetical protein n=1 Tax=Neobacillus massiliamazoniensis TaxID=1499688 RepID=UPI00159EC165|nr:hypothetical protein [Neobacillus massiliamazoniensis]